MTSINGKLNSAGITLDQLTNWIEMPVLYHYKFNDTWGMYAGGYYAFKSSAKLKYSGVEMDITNYHSSDYGLKLGGQYFIDGHQAINFDYSLGLADLLDSVSGVPEAVAKNSGVTVAYQYEF